MFVFMFVFRLLILRNFELFTGPVTPGGPLCVAKKKGDKGIKERVSKQKLFKCCHQGQYIIVLTFLERLEFEIFLVG